MDALDEHVTSTPAPFPADLYYPAAPSAKALNGLPRLMELYFRGVDLQPLGGSLIDRLERDPQDANALMDLSCLMFLNRNPELGIRLQADALGLSRHYRLPGQGVERLRVLALRTPGELMDNMPIEFQLHGSDVGLEFVYLDPQAPAFDPEALPPHDVACVCVCDSPATSALLRHIAEATPRLPRPTLNDPARIRATARETLWQVLRDLPGCVTPPTVQVDRAALQSLAGGHGSVDALLGGHAGWPVICRPCGSHAGHDLEKLDSAAGLRAYLERVPAATFYLSPFVEYRSADGQYRKYRITFVGGRAFPVHMALSARWMVHYLNGDMTDRADNRDEEARFFDRFDADFARRHARALEAIDTRLGLDCVSLDCGETPDGRLLVFEADIGGVVHAMDPVEGFGYKRRHMLRLFAALRELLLQAAQAPSRLKPWTAH